MSELPLHRWLAERPFHLALSSGFFGFFAHAGLLSVLEDRNLLPASISGSSAGALVGGLWAAGISSAGLRRELLALRRDDFWDPAPGIGLLAGRKFQSKVESLLPCRTFDKIRVPFAASVFDVRTRRTVSLKTGPLAPAICASCALPGMFHPVRLGGRTYLDGGVADRPALADLPQGRAVLYHHLESHSPWRLFGVEVPSREGMVTLVLNDLPRPGPFHLERGRFAFDQVRARTMALMDAPVEPAGCVLEAGLRPQVHRRKAMP
jgi:NTE family protein